tara:strand:+ start:478 stop:648 length:171 start_codon:yes stop_codon:yes gene_type:complete
MHLKDSTFVAGEGLSIADMTGYEVVGLATALILNFDKFEEIKAWHDELGRRFTLDE